MNIPHSLMLRYYLFYNKLKVRIKKNIFIGKSPKIYGPFNIQIEKEGLVEIGNSFMMKSGNFINPLCRNIKSCFYVQSRASLKIGHNVGISGCTLWVFKNISIGNNVLVGGDSIIMDSNAHSLDFIDRRDCVQDQKNRIDAPIIIEDDVLIGTRCIILKGVTIGARSVIAAGSVVSKSIPSDCIAGGNPCVVIKKISNL